MAKFTKTSTPGIFRRHAKECVGGPCDCAYVVVWRHRGKQATETFRTFSEAREGQGTRKAGDRRPTSRAKLERLLQQLDRELRRPHGSRLLGDD